MMARRPTFGVDAGQKIDLISDTTAQPSAWDEDAPDMNIMDMITGTESFETHDQAPLPEAVAIATAGASACNSSSTGQGTDLSLSLPSSHDDLRNTISNKRSLAQAPPTAQPAIIDSSPALQQSAPSGARRAWPEKLVIIAKPERDFITGLLSKGKSLTTDQQRAAHRLGLLPPPISAAPTAKRTRQLPHAAAAAQAVAPAPPSSSVGDFRAADFSLLHPPAAAASDPAQTTQRATEQTPIPGAPPHAFGQAIGPLQWQAVQTAEMSRAAGHAWLSAAGAIPPSANHPLARQGLILGSARPHAADGILNTTDASDSTWAPSGSLRQLEPELTSTLRMEMLPFTNIHKCTDPVDPPALFIDPPGPFTTEELIPGAAVTATVDHRKSIKTCIGRAGRAGGAAIAKRLRPEALILTPEETLNECGRGYPWRQRDTDKKWEVAQPVHYPANKKDLLLNPVVFEQLAKKTGMNDNELISWWFHGFPGCDALFDGYTVLGYPHGGAVTEMAAVIAANAKETKATYVDGGRPFPQYWPCRADCYNVVVQHGKPRVTLDRRMAHKSERHPEPVPSYNMLIELDAERERVGTLRLPRSWMFARAAAVLMTAGVIVKIGKYDCLAFFRQHRRQPYYLGQCQRLLDTDFGSDLSINFGDRDAMDHCCRSSDAVAHITRWELARLDAEYPSKAASVIAWLTERLGFAQQAGSVEQERFFWAVMFYFLMYVDDGGLVVIDDALYDKQGRPVMRLVDPQDSSKGTFHLHRADFYMEAATGIANQIGYETPDSKLWSMRRQLTFLGDGIDLDANERILDDEKRESYHGDLLKLIKEAKQQPNGATGVDRSSLNSIIHKLIHASSTIAIGRQHLHHVRKAYRGAKDSDSSLIFLGGDAQAEIKWWTHQLAEKPEHALPLASRRDFPASSASTIITYSDASREVEKQLSDSGFGAWSVILLHETATFVWLQDTYSLEELKAFSINVLEAHAASACSRRVVEFAHEQGHYPTHSLTYIDNTTAESINENGRTQTDGLAAVNARRLEWLIAAGVHQKSKRVASIDNDVADLLSRGRIDDALRFATDANLPTLRIHLSAAERDTSWVPTTWQL